MHSRVRSVMFALSFAVSASALYAQSAQPAPAAVDRVFRIGGVVPTVAGPAETITLAIYDSETGGTALWTEVQTVAVDSQGRYSVLLGSTDPAGLPLDLFATGEPRWLSTQVQRAGQAGQPRSLLTSVPYALRAAKASDADTLGGRPASSYLLAPSAGGDPAADSAAAASDPTFRSPSPLTSGSIGRIGKFVTGVDLGDSVMTESGGRIGVGTTAPLDVVHSAFTDGSGVLTGYAVQNLSSAAGAYSGMLFYDHLGNLGQFQGFNNSTKEYRINNIATNGTINFMTGSDSKFRIMNNGDIGLGSGTNTPDVKLHMFSNGVDGVTVRGSRLSGTIAAPTAVTFGSSLLRLEASGYTGSAFSTSRGMIRMASTESWTTTANGTAMEFYTTANGSIAATERMVLTEGGVLGIGTSAPTRAKVEINGAFGTWTGGPGQVLSTGAALIPFAAGTYGGLSLYASNQIAAASFAAFSDARIKRIEGRSNSAQDLSALQGIEVTDYSYIDTLTHGTAKQKKVIAQQVERVFPLAVNRRTDVVPDIYKKAQVKDGWVTLSTNLKQGERVRLIGKAGEGVYEVKDVAADGFRTSFAPDGDEVFVYGREVEDFRSVDYEAIAMLNVSATQELSRRLEQQTTETAALKQELAEMRATLTAALEAVAAAAKAQQR